MEKHAKYYEAYAQIERKVQFAPFTKEDERHANGIDGFEVVAQFHRKSRKRFEGGNLQEIKGNGAKQRQAENPHKIHRLWKNEERGNIRKCCKIERNKQREHYEATHHLISQRIARTHFLRVFLEKNGGHRCRESGHTTYGDAQAVAAVKREDAKETGNRDERIDKLTRREFLMENEKPTRA